MSYTQSIYHAVIRTKESVQTLSLNHSDDLYRYIWEIIKNKNYIKNQQEHHKTTSFKEEYVLLLKKWRWNWTREIGIDNPAPAGLNWGAMSYRKLRCACIRLCMMSPLRGWFPQLIIHNSSFIIICIRLRIISRLRRLKQHYVKTILNSQLSILN